jgi:putative transposase
VSAGDSRFIVQKIAAMSLNHQRYPNRRTVRLQMYDYGQSGDYFVTACTYERAPLFGFILNGKMCLNELGSIVWAEWKKSFTLRPLFEERAFIVMPNHWHGLIHIGGGISNFDKERYEVFSKPQKGTITAMMRGMLSTITSTARKSLGFEDRIWQSRFHEHVVQNSEEYRKIEQYILTNIGRWENDCFYR